MFTEVADGASPASPLVSRRDRIAPRSDLPNLGRSLTNEQTGCVCLFVYLIVRKSCAVFLLAICPWLSNPLPVIAAVTFSQGNTTGVTAVFGN